MCMGSAHVRLMEPLDVKGFQLLMPLTVQQQCAWWKPRKEVKGIWKELKGIWKELKGIWKELKGIWKELKGIWKDAARSKCQTLHSLAVGAFLGFP